MTAPRHPRYRLLRAVGRQLVRAVVVVAVLHLGAALVGTVVTAVVGAAALTVGAVTWWARVVEPRLFAPSRPNPTRRHPVIVDRRHPVTVDEERHLAFAQALAVVAARYLAECEREIRR
jgi:hypothetical protein